MGKSSRRLPQIGTSSSSSQFKLIPVYLRFYMSNLLVSRDKKLTLLLSLISLKFEADFFTMFICGGEWEESCLRIYICLIEIELRLQSLVFSDPRASVDPLTSLDQLKLFFLKLLVLVGLFLGVTPMLSWLRLYICLARILLSSYAV